MLNLMIAVIVNSMQIESSEQAKAQAEQGHDERRMLIDQVQKLQLKIDQIQGMVSSFKYLPATSTKLDANIEFLDHSSKN